ncbi:MAG: class I SAM-dependent methyltransferase [Panacibacter sp.]
MKDHFSSQAKLYANFRPHYPDALYDFLYSNIQKFGNAWDAGTGNGQVAAELAKKFTSVYASDISTKQLAEAPLLPNVFYRTETAENASYPDHYFDLITVAQAIHWFSFDQFYATVKRTLKPGGVIAVIGYGLLTINNTIDKWLLYFYIDVIGPYWDKERKYIDELYQTIPFPFTEIIASNFKIEYTWTKEQFLGYLNTWSAVQNFIKTTNMHPMSDELLLSLNKIWRDDEVHKISFPLLLRTGRL